MGGVTVHLTREPAAYLRRAGAFLTAHPVEHSVLLTSAHRYAGEPPGDALWLWAERKGSVVAAAQHTPPRGAYVSLVPEDAMPDMVRALHQARPALPGVGGMRRDAEAFGHEWSRLSGRPVSTAMAQGVFVADTVRIPSGVDGELRQATPADLGVVQSWSDAFSAELGESHAPRQDMQPRINAGETYLWQVAGRPVALAAASQPYGGVSRVSLVYTPLEHRRRGYAAACVAAVTARTLASGHRCMLYTDLANPTSNGVYLRVGYRRVGEAVDLRFG